MSISSIIFNHWKAREITQVRFNATAESLEGLGRDDIIYINVDGYDPLYAQIQHIDPVPCIEQGQLCYHVIADRYEPSAKAVE